MRTSVEKSVKSTIPGTLKFQLDCLPFIFSMEELEVIQQKGHIMKALAEEKRKPASREEYSFVQVCKGQAKAFSAMETAWLKYLNRRQNEAFLLQTEELYREYRQIRKQ